MSDIRNYTFKNGSAEQVLLGFDGEPVTGRFALSLGEDAALTLYLLQDEAPDVVQEAEFDFTLSRGASLRMVLVTLGGAQISNRLRIAMQGPRAECRLGGLYLPGGDQQMDFDVRLSHDVPECYSSQLFKGVLRDRARSRFDGLIYVAPDAQRTEAYQANHNLLLSTEARAEAKPQLEIYADDVKCSHGATVGRLNEEELFYMRSRGITELEAARLQQMAFVGEVLEMVSDPALRERLTALVLEKL